jgi:DNA modification methylase
MELYHGDCHELIKEVDSNSVQMIYTDPPYGVLARKDWDVPLRWEELWPEFWRILRDDGCVVIHGAQRFTVEIVQTQLKYFRYWWSWHKVRKTGFLNANRQPLRNIEEICVFYKRQCKYRPQMQPLEKPKYRKSGAKSSNTVGVYTGGLVTRSTTEHPCTLLTFPCDTKSIKPEPLCDYLIRSYTDEGDTVLDICMHTGVSGKAALKSGRKYVGMEKELEFFNIAHATLTRLDGQLRS